jgi:hypothetical protein
MAEKLMIKHQLMTLTCQRTPAPKLIPFDHVLFGYLAFFISRERLQKIVVSLKFATILKFHQTLAKRKYRNLYFRQTPGRKGPEQDLIELLIVEMKGEPTLRIWPHWIAVMARVFMHPEIKIFDKGQLEETKKSLKQ